MNLKGSAILMIVFFCCFNLTAQEDKELIVKGTVVSKDDGVPLPDVNVVVLGVGEKGVQTDFDGKYEIKVKSGEVLSFSYVGMKEESYEINDSQTLDVELMGSSELDEVVVIGYGTQKRTSLTGSVSKLDNENLGELPYSDISNAIKGKISGVRIQNTSAEVGESPKITIRGTGSISLSSEPLVVVDGFPMDDGLESINPNTIESIEVLKDASSTAIYGSRGSNGVILVTTKEGESHKPRYEFKTFTGFKQAAKKRDILDIYEYSDLRRSRDQLVENYEAEQEGREPREIYYQKREIGKRIIADSSGGATDWHDEAIRDPAIIKNFQVNVSGGNDMTTYYVSAEHVNNEGLLKDNYVRKTNLNAQLKTKLSRDLELKMQLRPSLEKRRRSAIAIQDTYRYETWMPAYHNEYTSKLTGKPIGSYSNNPDYRNLNFDYVDSQGNHKNTGNMSNLWGSSNVNPLASQLERQRYAHKYRLVTNGYLKWNINDHLVFKSSYGFYFNYDTQEEFTGELSDAKGQNSGVDANRLRFKYLLENTLNYDNNWNGHGIGALVGVTYEDEKVKFTDIKGLNFPTENIKTLNNAGTISSDETSTTKYQVALASFLGRVNYDYKGKYLLSLAGRMDGYSKFGPDNKYGFFPSVSIGWNVAKETFWRDNISFINRFKIRSSYGKSGSNNIKLEDYPSKDLLYLSNYSLGNNSLQTGLGTTGSFLGNRAISWETTLEFDTGIDLSFFKDQLNFTVDYYNKISEDLILKQPVSYTTGFDEYYNNIGKIQNQGFEFSLSTNMGKGDFSWNANANISFNRNKLISFGGSERTISNGERTDQYLTRVGDPYIQFYGYKTDGIFQDQDEIDNSPSGGVDRPGGLRRVDMNGDGVIDSEDRTVIGNPFPDFIWGFSNFFKYKNVDLNFVLQGSQGADVINGMGYYVEIGRYQREFVDNQWFDPNIPAEKPKERQGVPFLETDYVVEDASYASLREITLGYTLPMNASGKIGFKSIRIYALAQNLIYLTSSGFSGVNPEAERNMNNPLIAGYQRGAVPVTRQYSIGLNLSF